MNKLRELFGLLNTNQRKRFYVLQVLILVMAFMEIIGIVSIIPFMALVGDLNQLQQDTFISSVYQASGIKSELRFVFLIGLGVILMLATSAILSMYTVWRLSMFANKIGVEIADQLYTYYIKKGWLFHASGSSALLTKQIATESLRVTNGILVPFMQMNAKIVLALFMSIGIFTYDPLVAVIGLLSFAIIYTIIYKFFRTRIQINGANVTEVHEKRFRLMSDGFGGIKDVLLLGRDSDYINRFHKSGQKLAYSQGTNQALAQLPRYLVELMAFGSMIGLVLYLIISHEGNLGIILPILSVYALAIFKLLPAFQQTYASSVTIRGNIAGFDAIKKDLADSIKIQSLGINNKQNSLKPKQKISLNNITFCYPNKIEPILNDLNISIQVNSMVGIVGPSGSGKSTLIDILLGLIAPQKGKFTVDGETLNDQNLRSWQNTIGFVAQSIFLSEDTIAANVAFGIPQDQIDIDQVQRALKLAYLNDFVQSLDNGIHTSVGERGVQLSGGQRQRIGIARALYHNAKVLIFDEATSSLDGVSEKMIMQSINELSDLKTIIMVAHRLKTIQKCDQIFFINKGKVIDQGTYEDLVKTNEHFRNMAALA
jgi:ATP-binding cassette, subfamily B, bacterial PglK